MPAAKEQGGRKLKHFSIKKLLISFSLLVVISSVILAADIPSSMPPIAADFEAKSKVISTVLGHKCVQYIHTPLKEWGYPDGTESQVFIVTEAAKISDHPPLLVFLHGAGGKATPRPAPAPFNGFGPEFISLSLECFPPKGPDGWYGYFWAKKDLKAFEHKYSPPEHRYLAEIEWVARKYNVDRNRIYLFGHSMGGSGSLGLGMARGDIFAAICVGVPAGPDHACLRMGFPERKPVPQMKKPVKTGPTMEFTRPFDYLKRISGVGVPDAPLIVDFSSQLDGWSQNQENLIEACREGRHPLVFCWGTFGHTDDLSPADPLINDFPWLEVRRNEILPVFNKASTDGVYPGMSNKEGTQAGHINGYFRWKNISDDAAKVHIQVWLVDPATVDTTRRHKANTPPAPIPVVPKSSTADITLRRLQKFKVDANNTYNWELSYNGTVTQSGTVRPDECGLLTMPGVNITGETGDLIVEKK